MLGPQKKNVCKLFIYFHILTFLNVTKPTQTHKHLSLTDLQVSRELSVLLDGLLVIGDGLLRSFHSFLRLSDFRRAEIQHLPQLQLRLSGVLLQLVVHLVDGFLQRGNSGREKRTASDPKTKDEL